MPIPAVVVWLVTFIISAVLAVVLAPNPPDGGTTAATLSEFDFPTAEEGRSIPVIFGTVRIQDPNTVWYGHLKTIDIKG